jgi:hypothetical protein
MWFYRISSNDYYIFPLFIWNSLNQTYHLVAYLLSQNTVGLLGADI